MIQHEWGIDVLRFLTLLTALSAASSAYAASLHPIRAFTDPVRDLSYFGYNVAAEGEYALINAPLRYGQQPEGTAGTYLVNVKTGDTLHRFEHGGGLLSTSQAALSGKHVVVGDALGRDRASGSVYIFDRDSGALRHTLKSPTPKSSPLDQDLFGDSVSAQGDRVLVGAPMDGRGAAYLYDARTGALVQTFSPPRDNDIYSNWGQSVALDGSLAIVASLHNGFLDVFDVRTGLHVNTIEQPRSDLSRFGQTLSAHNGKLLVGAGQQDLKPRTASAFLYDLGTGELLHSFADPFSNPSPNAGPTFGFSVSLFNDLALIGAPLNWVANTPNAGTAYLFNAFTGRLLQRIVNPFPENGASFGEGLALSSFGALIGAYYSGQGDGAAYWFSFDPDDAPVPVPAPPALLLALSTLSIFGLIRSRLRSLR